MAKHSSKKRAGWIIARIENEIRRKFKEKVLGVDSETLSSVVGKLLLKNKKTLSIAESCAGGLLSSRITETPGSSDYFLGGVVCYSNAIKSSILGVPGSLIKKEGAVSRAVALKLARNVRVRFKTDYGIAISGIAGPSGGTKLKPIGLVYLVIASHKKVLCRKERFFGTRTEIQSRAANKALDLLRLELLRP